jgi:hypothetical protein
MYVGNVIFNREIKCQIYFIKGGDVQQQVSQCLQVRKSWSALPRCPTFLGTGVTHYILKVYLHDKLF